MLILSLDCPVHTFLYSYLDKAWSLCPSLNQNRGSHGAIGIGSSLFVIGGGGFDSNLATCERLNVQENEWKYIQPTTIYRHALLLVSIEALVDSTSEKSSYIYAIGGWIDGQLCSADVERYSVQSDTWTKCASMNVSRRLLGGCAYNDKIYTFGGNCDDGTNCIYNIYDTISGCLFVL